MINKLFLLLILSTFVSFAAHAKEEQIVIVDIKKILNESKATKSIQKQIEAKRKTIQKEIGKQEDKLRETDKDLSNQRSVLSKDVFDKKVSEFKAEVIDAQRNVQSKRSKLEKSYSNALLEVEKVVIGIVSELSQSRGFSMAVPKASTIYTKKGLDISDEVLETLNERLPEVKVKLEK